MRAVLVCGLGSLPGARAMDIPVYREYTQEIAFYDEEGHLAGYGAAAPDVLALQALRKARAQEGLVGKETLLEISFGHGASLFGREVPVPGKLSPPAADGGEKRRRKNEPDRNWLAKSLSLPYLGQTTSNAAATAISGDSKESKWGWLADEVVDSPAVMGNRFSETTLPEGGASLPSSPEAQLGLGEKSADAGGTVAQAEKNVPDPAVGDRIGAATWNAPGGDRAAAPDRSAPAAVAEMSQTRKMIAEISVGAKADFSALRESGGAAAAPSGAGIRPAGGISGGWATAPRPGSAFLWGAGRETSVAPSSFGGSGGGGSAPMAMSAPRAAGSQEWQGTWKAQSSVSAGFPSRFGTSTDLTPAPVAPAVVRPSPSSGGYKPGWY